MEKVNTMGRSAAGVDDVSGAAGSDSLDFV